MEKELIRKLIEKNYTLSAAESCTGGMFISRLIGVNDASRVIKCSFVTYSEETKEKYAHVKHSTIEKKGIVSCEVALEMAKGIAKEAGSNIGVGITGSAGPSSYPGIEIGTVCFGIYFDGQGKTYLEVFKNKKRNEVREEAVSFIISKLNEMI